MVVRATKNRMTKMTDPTIHLCEPVNPNLNTLTCKWCDRQWWFQNWPKEECKTHTIHALHVHIAELESRCLTDNEIGAKAVEFARLKSGWNSYKAEPITAEAIAAAAKLCRSKPSLVPTSRGGVQVEWPEGCIGFGTDGEVVDYDSKYKVDAIIAELDALAEKVYTQSPPDKGVPLRIYNKVCAERDAALAKITQLKEELAYERTQYAFPEATEQSAIDAARGKS